MCRGERIRPSVSGNELLRQGAPGLGNDPEMDAEVSGGTLRIIGLHAYLSNRLWGVVDGSRGVIGTSNSQVGGMATEQQHRHSGRQRAATMESTASSTSANGVQGNVNNASAGVAGVNHGAGPGIYGENQSGGYAGDFWRRDRRRQHHVLGQSDPLVRRPIQEDIAPIRDARWILRLRGVTFDWRRDEFPERRFRTGRDVGFIAQEVGEVHPNSS